MVQTVRGSDKCISLRDAREVAREAVRFGGLRDVCSGDIPSLVVGGITRMAQHGQVCLTCSKLVDWVLTDRYKTTFRWPPPPTISRHQLSFLSKAN